MVFRIYSDVAYYDSKLAVIMATMQTVIELKKRRQISVYYILNRIP